MTGRVDFIGAGPGAADLLTLRAARLLAEADIVAHDALVSPEVLALAPRARLIAVGKRANRPSTDQRFITRLIVRLARRGARVARLKGGDPGVFGRLTEEVDACRAAGVAIGVTPGVTAGVAAAAGLGVSLTARGVARSVAFVTPRVARGAADCDHWADAAAAADTAVIYMGAGCAAEVRDALTRRGAPLSRPVRIVENASSPTERVLTGVLADLPTLAEGLGDGPAVILIGDAVAAHAASPAQIGADAEAASAA